METLARRLVEGLRRGDPDVGALRTAGDPDPSAAAESFARAAANPDLGHTSELWAPILLRTARPGFGAQTLDALALQVRAHGAPPLDVVRAPTLPLVLGSSNFLSRLLLRNPGWVAELTGEPAPPEPGTPEPEWAAIRTAKYRGLLRIAARDLAGRPFEASLQELSDLADGCLAASLTCAARESGVAPPALFALGKLGGRELNLSSDVDLLFVHDRADAADETARTHAVTGLIQRFKTELERPTEDGFGYRVDLDLRPEGRAGVLSNSVDAALDYYESFGREWERQMLIRLRPVAGDAGSADAFRRAIAPFVYRRLIDPGVLDSVREMKVRIESERRSAGKDLETDLKEGPGGIRDVEFLVQSLQLFLGGRHTELRTGHTLDALDALARLAALPREIAASLRDAYIWLRRAEHALQLAEEQQTARFPRDPVAQLALARRMGYAAGAAEEARTLLLEDWTSVRNEVREHFEALVLRGAG